MAAFEALESLPWEIKLIIMVGLVFQGGVFLFWFFMVRNETVEAGKKEKND